MSKTKEELRVIAIRAHGQVERYAETGRRLTDRMCHQHGTRYCDCCPNCGARGQESHEEDCWREREEKTFRIKQYAITSNK